MKPPALSRRDRRRPAAIDLVRADQARRRRTVITPEGVPLAFMLAPIGSRLGALVVDFLLIGLVMAVTSAALLYLGIGVFGLAGMEQRHDAVGRALQFVFVVWIVAMFLLRNAWFAWFELGPRGATPGKRSQRIRVAARDGGRLTAEMIIARNLLRDVELFLPVSFLLAAKDGGGSLGPAGLAAAGWFLVFALFPLFNRDNLRAGDLVAGTWVVEAPKTRLAPALSRSVAGPSATYRFAEAELAVYGEYELQVLERVLREDRAEALAAVCRRICAKIGREADTGDERAFLEAYYTQLRARLEAGMRLGRRKADKYG
ncbi:RDD family protein [Novosphingobium bradum]|uniref:RDD family protein n=1 Tax=Novosphingobium bradum TaxID=1737444 RepID=A0ABV7IRZ6_9SPHN